MQSMKWESTVEHARKCQVNEEDVNILNFEGNGMSDPVPPNLGAHPGNREDTNLIRMVSYTTACHYFTQILYNTEFLKAIYICGGLLDNAYLVKLRNEILYQFEKKSPK
jgi:hypothetical protein